MPQVVKVIFEDVVDNDKAICRESLDTCTNDDYEDYEGPTKTRAEFVQELYQYLSMDDVIEDHKNLLIEQACPQMPDEESCKSDTKTLWQYFAKGLFSNNSSTDFCSYKIHDCSRTRYYFLDRFWSK